MNYNQSTRKPTWTHILTQGLAFVVACVCVVVLGGMMTVGVLKLQPFSVASNSMYPTLKVNDLVFVKASEAYDVGDVLSFVSQEHGGIVITHRCIGVERIDDTLHYYCSGDNFEAGGSVQDVVADDIVGKVVCSSAVLGNILNYIQTNKIDVLLIMASIFLVVYMLNNIDIYNNDKYNIIKKHT